MEFDKEFFDDEVREGFYVSGIMKRNWAAQLEVLRSVIDICEANDIKWFADFGTLLGAVRHKGFIPWDDDIDICMLREDYERFLMVTKDKLPDGLERINMHDKGSWSQNFLRVLNTRKFHMDRPFFERYHEFNFNAGVDIFVMDYINDDEEIEEARYTLYRGLAVALHTEDIDYREGILSSIEDFAGVRINRELPVVSQIMLALDIIARTVTNEQASYVTNSIYYINDRSYRCAKSAFADVVKLPFENMMINAPIGYDEYLTSIFGDYKTCVKEGGDHNYPGFLKNEEQFIEAIGSYPIKYKFDEAHLDNSERKMHKGVLGGAYDFAALMHKIHDKCIKLLEGNNANYIPSLLSSCQQAAINIGTSLERVYGEENSAVKILEEYCENLYTFGELLEAHGEETEAACIAGLNCLITDFKEELGRIAGKTKEVVILGYRARYWDGLDRAWRTMRDKGYKVTVIPMPYYDRLFDGSFTDMHYDIAEYPEYVDCTNYEDYDFELHHPDIIITQNPYDECNYTTSVNPFFYSSNIKNYTDKLVYIPYFELDEPIVRDTKAWQTMRYFCTVPGVVHADIVIVQSEQIRCAYIERLSDFAGEDTRGIWERRIRSKDSL